MIFKDLDRSPQIQTSKEQYIILLGIGLLFYALGENANGIPLLNPKISILMQLVGLGLIVIFTTASINIKNIKNKYLGFLFVLFIFWSISLIIRSVIVDNWNLKDKWDYFGIFTGARYGVMLYFAPLVLLLPQNLNFYKKVFSCIIIFCILFLFTALFNRGQLLDRSRETQEIIEQLGRSLAMPAGFLLLTFRYHRTGVKLLAFSVFLLVTLVSIYKARRGLTASFSGIFILAFLIYFFTAKWKFAILFISSLVFLFVALYFSSIYNINNNKLLNLIADRGDEDTRTNVELYFYNDMQPIDWVIGKGVKGQYYCPGIEEDLPTNYRNVMETGYLQIILKGGIIRLALWLLILVPAIFLGLFYSRNSLSKAAACWILIAVLSLYPTTVEAFHLQYLLVWISAGICYSKEIRQIPEQDMIQFFKNA